MNKDALLEYQRLKQKNILSTIKRIPFSGVTVTILNSNVRSLSRHPDGIESDNKTINKDIFGFTETQIKPPHSTCKIIETLNLFNVSFNNREQQ